MTDNEFLQLDPEALLKEFQELQKKKIAKGVIPSELRHLYKKDYSPHSYNQEEWFSGNSNEWYLVKSYLFPEQEPRDLDHFDEGYFDQPPPDIYFRFFSEFFREKIQEFLHLIGGFYLQTMIEATDDFVDKFLLKLIFTEVTKR